MHWCLYSRKALKYWYGFLLIYLWQSLYSSYNGVLSSYQFVSYNCCFLSVLHFLLGLCCFMTCTVLVCSETHQNQIVWLAVCFNVLLCHGNKLRVWWRGGFTSTSVLLSVHLAVLCVYLPTIGAMSVLSICQPFSYSLVWWTFTSLNLEDSVVSFSVCECWSNICVINFSGFPLFTSSHKWKHSRW